MSLKGFHILFITIATMLCVFVTLWAFVLERFPDLGLQIFGGTCAVAAIILPIYGLRFYRKAKQLSV